MRFDALPSASAPGSSGSSSWQTKIRLSHRAELGFAWRFRPTRLGTGLDPSTLRRPKHRFDGRRICGSASFWTQPQGDLLSLKFAPLMEMDMGWCAKKTLATLGAPQSDLEAQSKKPLGQRGPGLKHEECRF